MERRFGHRDNFHAAESDVVDGHARRSTMADDSCFPASFLPPPAPATDISDPSPTIRGEEWRRDHTLRKSHWLCRTCNVAIERTIAACETCKAADISSSELRAEDMLPLVAALRASGSSLKSLDVSHNPIGSAGVAALSSVLSSLPALTHLNLAATCASDAGAVALADALTPGESCHKGCPTLRDLSLMGCSIKDRGGSAFASLLTHDNAPPLVALSLGWNNIRGDAARGLAAAALASPHLESFCGLPIGLLRAGKLPPVPPLSERDSRRRPAIAAAEELHLNGHGCGSPGAFAVAALLPNLHRKTPLSAVVMPFQDLKDEGAVAVAEAAYKACGSKLQFLMLSRNDVGHEATGTIRKLMPELDDFHLRINNRGG